MGLTLTWKIGNILLIGALEVMLVKIMRSDQYIVSVGGTEFTVGSSAWTPLASGCNIRATLPRNGHFNKVRIQIDAPSMRVSRVGF